jgi:small nuclear ribonucleoprotein (snRNP)-like protein
MREKTRARRALYANKTNVPRGITCCARIYFEHARVWRERKANDYITNTLHSTDPQINIIITDTFIYPHPTLSVYVNHNGKEWVERNTLVVTGRHCSCFDWHKTTLVIDAIWWVQVTHRTSRGELQHFSLHFSLWALAPRTATRLPRLFIIISHFLSLSLSLSLQVRPTHNGLLYYARANIISTAELLSPTLRCIYIWLSRLANIKSICVHKLMCESVNVMLNIYNL